jgi:hypothetical protein
LKSNILTYAKAPFDNEDQPLQPNQETIDWLEKYMQSKTEPVSTVLSTTISFNNICNPTNAAMTTTTDNEQYSKYRENLKLEIDSRDQQTIALEEYIKHILFNAPLIGTGFLLVRCIEVTIPS